MLIDAKANVNAVAEYGNTALHIAAFRGHCDGLIMLLEAKADANTTNNEGLTALSRAAAWGSLDCMDVLIDIGKADISISDKVRFFVFLFLLFLFFFFLTFCLYLQSLFTLRFLFNSPVYYSTKSHLPFFFFFLFSHPATSSFFPSLAALP